MGTQIWQSLLLFGQAEKTQPPPFGDRFLIYLETVLHGAVGTLVYGLIGIGLVVLGFKVFDWITPKIDIQHELAEKNNLAVAVVVAAIIFGICYLVAVTVA